jgi:tetratricopeptide (TPR) repeat protein
MSVLLVLMCFGAIAAAIAYRRNVGSWWVFFFGGMILGPFAIAAALFEPSLDTERKEKLQEKLDFEIRRLRRKAETLLESKQFAGAVDCYSRAIELCPTNSHLLLARGRLFLELGNVPDAMADFEAAKRGYPKLREEVFLPHTLFKDVQDDPDFLREFAKRRHQRSRDDRGQAYDS